MSDWTRKGPLPDLPGQRRASDRAGGFRQYEAAPDMGGDRGERRRPPPFADDGKVRDFGNWERKGPLSPVPSAGPGNLREGGRMRSNEGPRERRQSPGWGEGRSNDGSRPPRREFQDRPQYDRQPTAPELDNQWRSKMRPDAPAKSPSGGTPDGSVPSSPAPVHAAPAMRPKLNLAKRTVTEDTGPASAASEPSSKSNPFGAARPIDTAAREKEIEEKRTLALRQKKEADDKAREERKAREAAEKKESAPATPVVEEGAEKPRANFEILGRVGEDGEVTQDDAPDAPANGNIVDDKAVKPKEAIREPSKTEGAWRRKSNTPAAPAESTTTEDLEADGWSTVTKPVKTARGGRRGGASGGPTRPIAS